MSEQDQPVVEAKPVGDRIGRLTKRLEELRGVIAAVTALVVAVGALVVSLRDFGPSDADTASDSAPDAPPAQVTESCVEIDAQQFPTAIRYSEWHRTPIRIRGRNRCDKPVGVYLTFARRVDSAPSFVLRVPFETLPGCDRSLPLDTPNCWDRQKPVFVDRDGEWEWEAPTPPLSLLTDPGSMIELAVVWDVRDFDRPGDPPLASRSVLVNLIDDRPR